MPTLAAQLAVNLTVADPDVVGSLAVFPLIADRAPTLRYVSFAAAVGRGVDDQRARDGGERQRPRRRTTRSTCPCCSTRARRCSARSRTARSTSPCSWPPAQQLRVPVSCVEAGPLGRPPPRRAVRARRRRPPTRSCGGSRTRTCASGSPPARTRAPTRARSGGDVAAKSRRHGVHSATGAMHDVFERHRAHLDAVARAVEPRCSQVGALAAIGGRFVVLDYVSDVDAWSALHGPLVQGYALDALEVADGAPPSTDDARDFVELLLAPRARGPGPSASARGSASTSADSPAPGSPATASSSR